MDSLARCTPLQYGCNGGNVFRPYFSSLWTDGITRFWMLACSIEAQQRFVCGSQFGS